METSDKPKRKYKKHKEGFKIAVDYKLNTKLKSKFQFDGLNLYPVYVEVRAKGKRTYFPSVHPFYVSLEEFDQFLKNPIVCAIIDSERKRIQQVVLWADAIPMAFKTHNPEAFYDNWLDMYQIWDRQANIDILLRDAVYAKLVKTFESNDKHLTDFSLANHRINYTKSTIDFLTSMIAIYSNLDIQNSISALRAYQRVAEFIKLYSRQWLLPDTHGFFFLEQCMKLSTLDNEALASKIKSLGNQSNIFFADLDTLREYVADQKTLSKMY
jgi:hypothetical protein